jgi:hypothetical protein
MVGRGASNAAMAVSSSKSQGVAPRIYLLKNAASIAGFAWIACGFRMTFSMLRSSFLIRNLGLKPAL